MEEELPLPVGFIRHMVTDALAGHEALNVDNCILNRSIDFPTKLSSAEVSPAPLQLVNRRLRQSPAFGESLA